MASSGLVLLVLLQVVLATPLQAALAEHGAAGERHSRNWQDQFKSSGPSIQSSSRSLVELGARAGVGNFSIFNGEAEGAIFYSNTLFYAINASDI